MDIKQRIGKLEDDKLKNRRILALDGDKQRDLVFRLRVITLSTILKTSGGLWRRSRHNSPEILSASHRQG